MMHRGNKGFTLVELIIVIAVIGILAAILIPVFSNVVDKANDKSALSDARNTVSQYLTDVLDGEDLPENIVIMVQKGGKFYLYGYNTKSTESIQISGSNPYEDCDTTTELVEKWSFNAKHPGELPESGKTDYDPETDGTFYLVPYNPDGTTDSPVKGFHGNKTTEIYRNLSLEMDETMGEEENLVVFHGMLLGGTYEIEGGGTPPASSGFTVTFSKGTLDGDPKAKVPSAVRVEEGATFIPSNYSASYNFNAATDDEWYVFDGWDQMGAITVTGDITLTAQWTKVVAERHTVTFESNGGELALATYEGWTNGGEIRNGADITSLVKTSTASKTEANFLGWKCGDVVYDSSYSGAIIVTGDMTFTAQFSDKTYTLSFDAGTGTGSYEITGKKLNDKVTMPTAEEAGVSKDGYVFRCWEHSSGVEYSAGGEYTVIGDATFTAQWTEDVFTVEYAQGTPSGATLPSTQKYDVGTAEVTLGTSTLAWYYMNGYNTTLGGAGLAAGATINTSGVTAGETITVTPTWVAKTMVVSYTDGGYSGASGIPGGTSTMDLSLGDYSRVLALGAVTPTLSGHTFTGWMAMFNGNLVSGGSGPDGQYVSGDRFTVTDEPAEKVSTLQFLACFESTEEQTKTVTVEFYDTWNEEVAGTTTIEVESSATTVAYSTVKANKPTYYVDLADSATAAIVDTTARFESDMMVEIDGTLHRIVSTYTGLMKIENNMAGNYALVEDLCLGDVIKHEPIGWTDSDDVWFTGVFDGQGNTIYAESEIDCIPNGSNVGLFALNEGTIKNVVLEFDEIEGTQYIGALCGQNDGIIENCHVSGRSVGTTITNQSSVAAVGGLVGVNGSSGTISKCSVTFAATSSNMVGCYGVMYVGGFAGQNYGTIDQSFAIASVNAGYYNAINNGSISPAYIGGFVGGNVGTVTNCYVKANNYIAGYQRVGGFIGWTNANSVVQNCYVNAGSYCFGYSNAAISIGVQAGTVSGCYAYSTSTGAINGFTRSSNIGSVCGWSTTIWNTSLAQPTLKNITIVTQ